MNHEIAEINERVATKAFVWFEFFLSFLSFPKLAKRFGDGESLLKLRVHGDSQCLEGESLHARRGPPCALGMEIRNRVSCRARPSPKRFTNFGNEKSSGQREIFWPQEAIADEVGDRRLEIGTPNSELRTPKLAAASWRPPAAWAAGWRLRRSTSRRCSRGGRWFGVGRNPLGHGRGLPVRRNFCIQGYALCPRYERCEPLHPSEAGGTVERRAQLAQLWVRRATRQGNRPPE